MRSTCTTVGLLATLLLGGAGSAPAARDTLTIGIPTDVSIFDTHKATGLHNGSVLVDYGEPSIWAAKKSLKGIDFNPLESLHPLHRAYFEE